MSTLIVLSILIGQLLIATTSATAFGDVADIEAALDDDDPPNLPPTLEPIPDQVVVEGQKVAFTAKASDPNGDAFSFSLAGNVPHGASITKAGKLTWETTEAQGPGTYVFEVVVTDSAPQPLSDRVSVRIIVSDENSAPSIHPIPAQFVTEKNVLVFTAKADDTDIPVDVITFSLGESAPAGASITANGVFRWRPTEKQGPETYTFKVIATDDGQGNLSAKRTVSVTVRERNTAPTIEPLDDMTVDEGTRVTFKAHATDQDKPADTLTFSLTSKAPKGASITEAGTFNWTPTEKQGPGEYTFRVLVTDDGTPAKSDSTPVTIRVREADGPPRIVPIDDQVSHEGDTVHLGVDVKDPDGSTGVLTFGATGLPDGLTIDPATGTIGGEIAITEAKDHTQIVTITLTEEGQPAPGSQMTFEWLILDTNRAPVGASAVVQTVDSTPVEFELVASDPDGDDIEFVIERQPGHGALAGSGPSFRYTPSDGYIGTDRVRYRVTDGEDQSKVYTVTIEVGEATVGPNARNDTYTIKGDSTFVEGSPGLLGNDGFDDSTRVEANLVTAPDHGDVNISPDGSFTYTPHEGYVGRDDFEYKLTDLAGLWDTATVNLRVASPVMVMTETRGTAVAASAIAPPSGPANHIERSLVVMSAAARTSIERVGIPLILLAIAIAVVAATGRFGLGPMISRGAEQLGTIRMYDAEQGFGLVTRDAEGGDVFVHSSSMRGHHSPPHPGDRVRFRVTQGNFRDMATRVRPVTPEA